MKKLTIILFVLIGLMIAFFIIKEYRQDLQQETVTPIYTVSPTIGSTRQTTVASSEIATESLQTSLIPLYPTEIFISAESVDLNGDEYYDQIVAVKNSGSSFIHVLIGLYNPFFKDYERSFELITDIELPHTFAFSVTDITGTHQNSLLISGFSTSGDSVLQAWLLNDELPAMQLELIADLKASGSIFIDQAIRGSSYAFDTNNGDSFPIWIYTADPNAVAGSLDQLHIMYDWDSTQRGYVQQSQELIPGRTVNIQELAKIQDGTEETFAGFLDGLWMSTSYSSDNMPFLFFDYENQEIVFLQNDTTESYIWQRSILRTNGILIYMTNKTIANLLRRVDISLVSVNEIRIRITDELNMPIESTSVWDGNYVKHTEHHTARQAHDTVSYIADILQSTADVRWQSDMGYDVSFSQTAYTAQNATVMQTGVFRIFQMHNQALIQFKSPDTHALLSGFYGIEIIEDESMSMILSPITMLANTIEYRSENPITLRIADSL
ncbi:MAG: pallilysin-related adhesin [Spirochaetales bacterium]